MLRLQYFMEKQCRKLFTDDVYKFDHPYSVTYLIEQL